MMKDKYLQKIENAFLEYLLQLKEPQILEFGVRHGQSTELFLEICEKTNGFLYSVDIDNYENKFSSK